ncbi:efflux RND transporter periplasmic adaptor subunit [Thalassotalea atypica]|uniref:efflux RND transporter periplasmic adaptor subunit n=1 Tax=Thalassotalea atypica TaxID=2054316 RepID=UPI0025733F35|nr:efflux RND transporter periplasmic adaptor subunit [Thalassotalea atypica]
MKIHRWIIAILFIALTISGLGFFKFQQIQAAMDMAAAFPEPSASVNTITTEVSEHQSSFQVTGQAISIQAIEIQNELAGTIDTVNFKGGDQVKKGQHLLSLNILDEQAQLVAARAKQKLAKINFERMGVLVAEKKVSQQDYDAAEADLSIARAEIASLESTINKKQIFASFDGQVSLETYQVGQFLPANTTISTLIGNGPEIWIDFQLAQTKQRLSIGDKVAVRSITNGQQQFKSATIIAINSQIKAQSRHLSFRAELPDGQSWLNHNEIVQVRVFNKTEQTVLLPKAAVNRNHFGAFVYELVQDDDQQYRAKKVPVELGVRTGDLQVIHSGLQPNMLIATDGSFKLREGILVYPKALAKNSLGSQLLSEEAK